MEARLLLSRASVAPVGGPAQVVTAAVGAKHGAANAAYLADLESDLTGAAPRPARQAALLRALDRGVPRVAVVRALLGTPVVQRSIAAHEYQSLLGSAPTRAQTARLAAIVRNGGDVRDVLAVVAGGADYYRVRGGGTDAGFVAALYTDMLDRSPTASESTYWVRRLEHGASRTSVARTILMSREAMGVQVRDTLASTGGQRIHPGMLARALRQPGGMNGVLARTYSSATYYARTVSPATPPAPGASAPAGINATTVPLSPGFDLLTQWYKAAASGGPHLDGSNLITAAPDGTIFVTGGAGDPFQFYAYSPQATPNPTWTPYDFSSNRVSQIQSLSAVSNSLLIGVAKVLGQQQLVAFNLPGAANPLDFVPGYTPSKVVALSDTAWIVMDTQQNMWRFSGGGNYTELPPAPFGTTPSGQFAVDSQGTVWSIFNFADFSNLWYLSGDTWVLDRNFPSSPSLTGLSTTSDGSVWAVGGQDVFLLPPGGNWQQVAQTPPASIDQGAVSGSSRYRMAALLGDGSLQILSVGIADQQGQAFPSFNADEQNAYNYISARTLVPPSVSGGIRAEYTNRNFSVSGAPGVISTLTQPADVTSSADWTAVKAQIILELDLVSTVRKLFDNIESLAGILNTASTDALGLVGSNVAMGNSTANTGSVVLRSGGLVKGILSALSVTGALGDFSVAASVFSSILDVSNALNSQAPYSNSNTTLTTTYDNLVKATGHLYSMTLIQDGNAYNAIVSDWFKLQAVALAANGPWSWDTTRIGMAYNAAMPVDELYYYQALMPAKWEVVQYLGYPDCYWNQWYECQQPTPPGYDLLTTLAPGYTDRDNYQFLVQVGASTDLYKTGGAFPSQILLNAIYALGVSQSTLFSAQDGWNMQVITNTY